MRNDDSTSRVASRIFLLCIRVGAYCAFLIWAWYALLSIMGAVRWEPALGYLLIGIMASTIPGVISFLPVWLLLRRKNFDDFARPLVLAPVVATGVGLAGNIYPHMLFGGHLVLLLTAAYMRWFLPDFYREGEGVCHRCGYDLTGNISGICPECGTATNTAEA